MEIILNRWRGTGVIFTSIPFIKGVHIYDLYLGLLFGYMTEWYIGLCILVGFMIGESFGWGKWLGSLTYPENITDKVIEDKEGYSFPYIHYIANFFIKQEDEYFEYCKLALAIRGFVWGLCIYLPLLFGYISLFELFVLSLIYGLGFVFSTYLGKNYKFTFSYKYLDSADKWGSTELYYGAIHMICNLYLISRILC